MLQRRDERPARVARRRRQQEQLAKRLAIHPGGEDRRTTREDVVGLLRRLEDLDAVLVEPRFLLQPRQRLLDGLQVGEDELGVDDLHVVAGVDLALDVDDVGVGEDPDHLADRVALADVGEELVAETGALARTLDDARDVDEGHRRGQDPLAAEDAREHLEPVVRYADDADVRLDRREGVVRCEHVVLGQRVEQRRLSDVGETDDSDGESHEARF